LDRATAF